MTLTGLTLTAALKKPEIEKAMSALGRNSVDFSKPTRITPFKGYAEKNLYFREWDLKGRMVRSSHLSHGHNTQVGRLSPIRKSGINV